MKGTLSPKYSDFLGRYPGQDEASSFVTRDISDQEADLQRAATQCEDQASAIKLSEIS